MEEHASLLVVQSLSARRTPRPVAWLALVLFDLDVNRPPGARRLDARDHVARLAALLAVSADWRSGRRARPGRQVAAAMLGLAERTITRHLRLLEGRELARRACDGQLLTAEQRAAARADEDVSAEQRKRWVDRAEWTLHIPAWVREITDEQLWPYIQRAVTLLDDLAVPARPRPAVDNPVNGAVDNRPGQAANHGSVTPSSVLGVFGSLPLRRGSFSCPVAVDKPPAAASPVTAGRKEHTGGASRPSPTRGDRRPGRQWTPGVVRLARELVADGRFGFTRGADDVFPIAGVLDKLGLGRWTADDVAAEVQLRLAECRKAMFTEVKAPALYFAWLLKHAVPGEPPAQIAAALAESAHAELVERENRQRREWAERERRKVAPANSAGGRQARRLVDGIAERRRQAQLDDARRRRPDGSGRP